MKDTPTPEEGKANPSSSEVPPEKIQQVVRWWKWFKRLPPLLMIAAVVLAIWISWPTISALPGVSFVIGRINTALTSYDGPTHAGVCRLFVSSEQSRLPPVSGKLDAPDTSFGERVLSANADNVDVVHKLVSEPLNKATMQFWFAKAASGKSTLARELASMHHGSVAHVRLKDIPGEVENITELWFTREDGERIPVSSLPASSNCSLREYPIDHGAKVLILDDLDEIHPECATKIVGDAYKLMASNQHHVILLGRPESFANYATASHLPEGITQRPVHSFRAHSELELKDIVIDYLNYKKPPESKDASDLYADTAEQYVNLQREYPFVRETVASIGQINCMAEAIHGLLQREQELLPEEIQDRFLSCALGRNQSSHNRPDAGDNMYAAAFMDVAAYFAQEASEANGEFEVRPDSTVRFVDGEQKFSVNVQDLLCYSGVATFDPVEFRIKRFRFTPSWLHGVWLKRRAGERYEYTCDYRAQ